MRRKKLGENFVRTEAEHFRFDVDIVYDDVETSTFVRLKFIFIFGEHGKCDGRRDAVHMRCVVTIKNISKNFHFILRSIVFMCIYVCMSVPNDVRDSGDETRDLSTKRYFPFFDSFDEVVFGEATPSSHPLWTDAMRYGTI